MESSLGAGWNVFVLLYTVEMFILRWNTVGVVIMFF